MTTVPEWKLGWSLHKDSWADLFSCQRYDSSSYNKFRNCVINNGFNRCGATYIFDNPNNPECVIGVGESRKGIEYVSGSVTVRPYQRYAVRLKPRNTEDKWEAKFFLFWNTTTGEELIYYTYLSENWDRREVVYASNYIKDGGTFTIEGEYAVDDWGRGWSGYDFYIYKSQVYKGDSVSFSETDTCPTNTSCVIKNEWICDNTGNNCIQTIRDKIKTGLSPLPFCYTTDTRIGNYMICAYGDRIEVRGNPDIYGKTFTGKNMWFWIKRDYECPSEGVDIDLSRFGEVVRTTSYSFSAGNISYKDFSCKEGTCVEIGSDTVNVGVPDTCPVAFCTVQTVEGDTTVFGDKTNRSQTQGGVLTSPLEVRSCQRGTNGWVCPVGSGEVLVEDCACDIKVDGVGFSTTIAAMQAVVDASKDLICSTVNANR